MKNKKLKKKRGRKLSPLIRAIRRSKKKGAKFRQLNRLREKIGEEAPVDKFIDEETPVSADDAMVSHPTEHDVRDVLSELDGYRDYLQESRGNGLTYGDY